MTTTVAPRWHAAFSPNLALAMTVSGILPTALGALAVPLDDALGVSRGRLGVLAAVYQLMGAVASLWIARGVVRLGGRLGLLMLHAYAAAGLLAAALAPSYAVLLVAVALLGPVAAAGNPLTNHVIAEHAPRDRWPSIVGVKQSGVQLAILVAGLALPALAHAANWRLAMLAMLVLPAVGAALTSGVVPPDRGGRHRASTVPAAPRAWRLARTHRFLAWMSGYAAAMGLALSATLVYLPAFAHDMLGFSVQLAGLVAATTGLLGVVGRVAWGRFASGRQAREAVDLLGVAIGSMIGATCVLASGSVATWLVWPGAVGLGGVAALWNVIANTAAIRYLPANHAAAGSAVIQFGFFAGLVAGPIIFGLLVGSEQRYTAAMLFVVLAFGASTAIALAWATTTRGGQADDQRRPPRPVPSQVG
ncbi:MAG TPA: MFS transporter [Ilumatobacter sp.]|nr:MFS transporter [Ilumatobacter sp.]